MTKKITRPHEYDNGIIRSSAEDVRWLFAMFAAARTALIAQDTLAKRLEVVHEADNLKHIQEELLRITRTIFLTFPPEKHETINRQLDNIHYKLEIGKSPFNDTGSCYTNIGDLDTLIYYAHRMTCIFCSHPTWCNSRCDLGKALDHCCPESRTRKESWSEINIESAKDEGGSK